MEWDVKDTLKEKHNIDVKVTKLKDPKVLYFCHEILVEVLGAREFCLAIFKMVEWPEILISCEITITIPGIIRHQTSIVRL